jgi:hypothetical protein
VALLGAVETRGGHRRRHGQAGGGHPGLVFLIVGVILTVTVIGAIVGIPLIVFGLLLIIRGLF